MNATRALRKFVVRTAMMLVVSQPIATYAQSAPERATPAPAQPKSAAQALDVAAAAYEYGDMNKVVDFARAVAEGAVASTPTERGNALRLLGIGLYLTERNDGAHAAFTALLRLFPKTQLDPTATRPEVVAFFKEIAREHHATLTRAQATDAAARRNFDWNLLPPAGQFQNGDPGRGYAFLAIEAVALGTAITTASVLHAWEKPGYDFGDHQSAAKTLKTLNATSVVVLACSVAVGIVDGIMGYGRGARTSPTEDHVAFGLGDAGAFKLSF